MTPADIARNARAIRNLAGRLERLGFVGDCHTEAEHIALNLLADGYKPVDTPVAPRGPGASRERIEAAKKAAADAVRAAKTARQQTRTQP